jgi:hypothetical protein
VIWYLQRMRLLHYSQGSRVLARRRPEKHGVLFLEMPSPYSPALSLSKRKGDYHTFMQTFRPVHTHRRGPSQATTPPSPAGSRSPRPQGQDQRASALHSIKARESVSNPCGRAHPPPLTPRRRRTQRAGERLKGLQHLPPSHREDAAPMGGSASTNPPSHREDAPGDRRGECAQQELPVLVLMQVQAREAPAHHALHVVHRRAVLLHTRWNQGRGLLTGSPRSDGRTEGTKAVHQRVHNDLVRHTKAVVSVRSVPARWPARRSGRARACAGRSRSAWRRTAATSPPPRTATAATCTATAGDKDTIILISGGSDRLISEKLGC